MDSSVGNEETEVRKFNTQTIMCNIEQHNNRSYIRSKLETYIAESTSSTAAPLLTLAMCVVKVLATLQIDVFALCSSI